MFLIVGFGNLALTLFGIVLKLESPSLLNTHTGHSLAIFQNTEFCLYERSTIPKSVRAKFPKPTIKNIAV
jgi:hypothetical protein